MTGRMLGRALAWVPKAQRSRKQVRAREKDAVRVEVEAAKAAQRKS